LGCKLFDLVILYHSSGTPFRCESFDLSILYHSNYTWFSCELSASL